MALEDMLLIYGPLGIMVVWFMWRTKKQDDAEDARAERMATLIENNTVALTKCADAMNSCPYKNQKK